MDPSDEPDETPDEWLERWLARGPKIAPEKLGALYREIDRGLEEFGYVPLPHPDVVRVGERLGEPSADAHLDAALSATLQTPGSTMDVPGNDAPGEYARFLVARLEMVDVGTLRFDPFVGDATVGKGVHAAGHDGLRAVLEAETYVARVKAMADALPQSAEASAAEIRRAVESRGPERAGLSAALREVEANIEDRERRISGLSARAERGASPGGEGAGAAVPDPLIARYEADLLTLRLAREDLRIAAGEVDFAASWTRFGHTLEAAHDEVISYRSTAAERGRRLRRMLRAVSAAFVLVAVAGVAWFAGQAIPKEVAVVGSACLAAFMIGVDRLVGMWLRRTTLESQVTSLRRAVLAGSAIHQSILWRESQHNLTRSMVGLPPIALVSP